MAVPVAVVAGLIAARLDRPDPLTVSVSPVDAEAKRACAHLVDALPSRLGALPARRVTGSSRAAAAWGNPPVVLRCGLPPRAGPVGDLLTLDRVDWTFEADNTGVTWWTVRRRVTVEVRVPGRYDSQGPLLAMLSPALLRTVPAG